MNEQSDLLRVWLAKEAGELRQRAQQSRDGFARLRKKTSNYGRGIEAIAAVHDRAAAVYEDALRELDAAPTSPAPTSGDSDA